MKHFLALVITCSFLASCSSVQFYSDADITKKTGVPIYTTKPYLLVHSNKDTIRAEVINIQDRSNPIYVRTKPGLGSAKLEMSLENNVLKSFGATTDSKVPETITSVSGLLSTLMGKTVVEGQEESKALDLNSIKNEIEKAISILNGLNFEENELLEKKNNIIEALGKAESEIDQGKVPETMAILHQQSEALIEIKDKIADENTQTEIQNVIDILDRVKELVKPISQPSVDSSPFFMLFEIDNSSGVTLLKQIWNSSPRTLPLIKKIK